MPLTVFENPSSSVQETGERLIWAQSLELDCNTITPNDKWLGQNHSTYLYHWSTNISKEVDRRAIATTAKWCDLDNMTSRL